MSPVKILYSRVYGSTDWFEGDVEVYNVFEAEPLEVMCGCPERTLQYSWTELQPEGNVDKRWNSVKITPDGQTIILGEGAATTGSVWISTNRGSSWTQYFPSGSNNMAFHCVHISDNGQIIFAGRQGSTEATLYISKNGGSSWSQVTPGGISTAYWGNPGMSRDGSKLVVSARTSPYMQTFISHNGGDTWQDLQPFGASFSSNTAGISPNGNTIIIKTGDNLYISRDGGNIWDSVIKTMSLISPGDPIAISHNELVAVVYVGTNEGIFVTRDNGVNWSVVNPTGDPLEWLLFMGHSTNEDGCVIFTTVYEKRCWLSTDRGYTWEEVRPIGDVDNMWKDSDMTPNADTIVVVSNWYTNGQGRVYLGELI